jgi:hypothetical protein
MQSRKKRDNAKNPLVNRPEGLDPSVSRMFDVIADHRLSLNGFCSRIGMNRSSVKSYIECKSSLPSRWIRAIVREFPEYSPHWLTGCDGPKYIKDYIMIDDGSGAAATAGSEGDEYAAAVESHEASGLAVPAEEHGAGDSTYIYNPERAYIVDGDLIDMPPLPMLPPDAPQTPVVPLYGGAASAGHGAYAFEANNVLGTISVRFASPGDIAIAVRGNSMTPLVKSGEVLILRERNTLRGINPDRLYVVATNDDIFIKCIKRVDSDGLLLHSTNPDFSDFFVESSEVRRIFNVVGIVSPLRAYVC